MHFSFLGVHCQDVKQSVLNNLRVRKRELACVIWLALLALLIGSRDVLHAADQINSRTGLVVYSDLNFIELEGEFVGLQIAIVPYRDGQKILWRSAGPFLNPPLLLNVVKVGDEISVVVPEEDPYKGRWKLNVKNNIMYAVGPEGQKYSLKRI